MKYSELISFKPIESTIQLLETAEKSAAINVVSTYVMSDAMAEGMQAPVIDQLQMENVVDNKAVMVVGNYGTGKSHLMSVIAAIASDKDNLQYLQNWNFRKNIEVIAGKFEVLRMKVDGLTMALRNVIMGEIEADFKARGIDYTVPDLNNVRDNSKLVKEAMAKFQELYPGKGYLIVIDELLSYLRTRNGRQIILDLAFLQTMAEMCSKSPLRLVCGVQESIFDSPEFSFVSDTLKKVGDRFTQLIITKEATAYVVSERILKKNRQQKYFIRKHLEKFASLYTGMSSRLDEFVDLFPIHPSYIDVFNRIYIIENRHILENISICIRKIFDTDVPEDSPGIISFDEYWPAIKSNGLLKTDTTISRVVNASQQLEDIINRAFPKPAYKPLAIKIIYALSVHRLTTKDLEVQFGMTAENLKDDLCLFLPMPEMEADFLIGTINATLKTIMTTVSGQFIIFNEANNQYYIDVDKIVDYDEKINQKAVMTTESELNACFYKIVYSCLEWDAKQYVTNFEIYEYDLNWESHNVFREGYLFMGLPGERSTAQPERDFYVHIMPPYGSREPVIQHLPDEVYFFFRGNDDFKETLGLCAAALSLAQISEGNDKEVYLNKADSHHKKLEKFLSENKNTCFNVTYDRRMRQIVEVLKGKYNRDANFKETIDTAASLVLDRHFSAKYPEFPAFRTKLTTKNINDTVRSAIDYFAGNKNQRATIMLQSLGVLDSDKIKPEKSKYAKYFIDKVKALPPQGVLNFSDLFEDDPVYGYVEKEFKISCMFTPIIFLSMVHAGYAVITLKNGTVISISNLEQVSKFGIQELCEFKYLSRPSQIAMAELRRLFEVLGLSPALLDNPDKLDRAVSSLMTRANELSSGSVFAARKLIDGFELWGEPLVSTTKMNHMKKACEAVRDEFSNYGAKFNTPAKLNNFRLSMEDVNRLADQIKLVKLIMRYHDFKVKCSSVINYISNIEYIELGEEFKSELEQAREVFSQSRDSIINDTSADAAAQEVETALSKLKDKYIEIYIDEHRKKRLDATGAVRLRQIRESSALANLRKLRVIEIVSSAELSAIEQDISSLTVCCELKLEDLKSRHVCPHCRYQLGDKVKDVYGQLDDIEKRLDVLLNEWTETLFDTISDPALAGQKEYLTDEQKKAVADFESSCELPERVDDVFVKAITALLRGFEPVIIDTEEFLRKLEELPPLDETSFAARIRDILEPYTSGKDASRLRIVVKRKDSGV